MGGGWVVVGWHNYQDWSDDNLLVLKLLSWCNQLLLVLSNQFCFTWMPQFLRIIASHRVRFNIYKFIIFKPKQSNENLKWKFSRFSHEEIKKLYWSFKTECPTGLVNQENFKSIFSKFFPTGGKQNRENIKGGAQVGNYFQLIWATIRISYFPPSTNKTQESSISRWDLALMIHPYDEYLSRISPLNSLHSCLDLWKTS